MAMRARATPQRGARLERFLLCAGHGLTTSTRCPERTTNDFSFPARVQRLGGRRDHGGLRAALHAQELSALERIPRGQHGVRFAVIPGTGGHWWRDCAELRLQQRHVGHPHRGVADLSDRPAHCLLRSALWAGHGPAHARRRLWLPGLHHHLADLCGVHLHLLCAGGGHHGAGAADGGGLAAGVVLRRVVAGGAAPGHARHHTHIAPAGVDAAAVAVLAAAALCVDCAGPAAAVPRLCGTVGPQERQQPV
ncbi:hypothetical protein D3C71_1038620 [compost metagenome]